MNKRMLMLASVPSMIGQFNMENIKILMELGYKVDIVCNFTDRSVWNEKRIQDFEKEIKDLNINMYQVDFSRNVFCINKHLNAYKQLMRILSKNRYDFVHCHTPIGGVIGRIACKKMKVKCIYTAHGFHFYKGASLKNWIIYYSIEKMLSKWTEKLITINYEDYNLAKKKFKKTDVIYVPGIGIDTQKFFFKGNNREEKRDELGLQKDDIMIFSVGELSKRKNHEIIIKTIKMLNNSKIKYYICGQGMLYEKYCELIKELNLEQQVFLLGFRTDVRELCHAADLYVFPSLQEGLPVALMEAMASGLPCVVSDIRGNNDLIEYAGGELVTSQDIYTWKEKIEQVIDRDRIIMGEYNVNKIKDFGKDVVNDNMREIYQNC